MLASEIIAFINGTPGETLFHTPLPGKLLEQDDVVEMMRKIRDTQDSRSFVLVSAMVTETYVERLLSLLLPKYSLEHQLASKKIALLASFEIIPKHITDAALAINQVRNKFAHDLQIVSFAELAKKFPNIITQLRAIALSAGNSPTANTTTDAALLFDGASFVATQGLRRYQENVRFYASFVRSEGFMNSLTEQHEREMLLYRAAVSLALEEQQKKPRE